MLSGRKPLAMFYAGVKELPDEELVPERAFSTYVEAGRFVRDEEVYQFEHSESHQRLPVKYVFFALKGEEWRISRNEARCCSLQKGWPVGRGNRKALWGTARIR
jgi:hypothetical protein